jgi:hypothetical protein
MDAPTGLADAALLSQFRALLGDMACEPRFRFIRPARHRDGSGLASNIPGANRQICWRERNA